jgi:biotin carboxylase
MPRVLLLLPSATYRAHDFLAAARKVGADVVVASERRQALSGAMGDRALTVRLHRPQEAAEAIVRLSARTPLDAVVAVDDQGVLVAALAGERLGLPGNPPEAAARTRDKAAMRAALAAAAVPQPDFRVAAAGADVAAMAAALGAPVVVKPLALSASRGVIRADDPAAAAAAAQRVRAILAAAGEDPAAPLLVERYVPGVEVAVEGLMRGGRLEVLAIFDKPDPLEGPFFEETLFVTPSRLADDLQGTLRALTARATTALGLREGPIHAELRTDGERVWVLELAARSIGGLCSRSLRFGVGVSLEELILRHALGLPLEDLGREGAAAGVAMIPIPRAGVLQEVAGQDDALAVPGVAGLEISIAPGRPVRPLPEGDRYLGFIFARGERPADVERALRASLGRLEIAIESSPGEESSPSPLAAAQGTPAPGG